MFVCAGNGEEFDFASSIGVGLIQSTINLTKICQIQNPQEIIFIGSAGSYSKEIELLEIYVSEEATQIESSLLCLQSYTPIANQIKADWGVSRETHKFPKAIVNSSNYITIDPTIAKQMQQKGVLLENMEFYAVLSVAQAFKIPAFGVFCVSNYCHDQAHQEFLQNASKVKEKLLSFCQKELF